MMFRKSSTTQTSPKKKRKTDIPPNEPHIDMRKPLGHHNRGVILKITELKWNAAAEY